MEKASTHAGRPSAFRLKNPLPLDVALSFGRCIKCENPAGAQRKGKTSRARMRAPVAKRSSCAYREHFR